MRVKLLGMRETQGIFQDKPFHSLKLHISEPFTASDSYGEETSVHSIKFDRIPYIFGRPIEVKEIAMCVGLEIDISFDKNGTINKIDLECFNQG